jgi:hypothetical protein
MPAKNKKEKWEKEFSKRFGSLYWAEEWNGPEGISPTKSEIKSFISAQIRQARQQEREEIAGMIDRMIKEELAAKPADDLEKTAEWYKVSSLKILKSQILNRH